MAGRPSLYTDELAQHICERVANGETLTKISNNEDMPGFVTIYDWSRDNPIFSKMLWRAKELAGHKHSELSHEVVFENPNIDSMGRYDSAHVKLLQLKSHSHARLAGQYNKLYNDKISQQHREDDKVEVEI